MVEPGVSVADVSHRIAFFNMLKNPVRMQYCPGPGLSVLNP